MSAPVARKRGPSLLVALLVVALGLVIAVPTAVLVTVRAVRWFTTPSVTTPSTTTRHLTRGTWVVFERTDRGLITPGQDGQTTIAPGAITVTGPTGAQPEIRPVTADETISRGSRTYTAAVQFKVDVAGTYEIRLDAPDPGEVLITRSFGDTFRGVLPLLAAGTGGGLLVLVGLVLVIVGIVRRSTPRQSWAPIGPSAPGWYPDPYQPGRWRWWDGARWSPHQG